MSKPELDNQNDANSDDLYEESVIKVDPKQRPLRLDKFLMDRLEKVSRNRVQNAIRAGAITVDGKEVKPNFKIKPGQEITVVVPRSPGGGVGVIPQDIPLDIVYEDEDILIVNKKAGMVVHPGIGHHEGTLVNALAHHFGHDSLPVLEGNFNDRLGLVHRIDKNTSGLLVIAKSDYAMTHLAKQFFKHTVERTYYALIWGQPEEEKGTVIGNVGRHPRFRTEYTVFPEGEGGKHAVTHYEVLEGMYYVSLIKCNLETGRTHQIRVHMQHLGHPLFNDDKYKGDRVVKGTIFSKYKSFVENTFTVMPRHALHAKSLGFIHPRTEKKVYFESELPSDFTAALERWRRYLGGRRAAIGDNLT